MSDLHWQIEVLKMAFIINTPNGAKTNRTAFKLLNVFY